MKYESSKVDFRVRIRPLSQARTTYCRTEKLSENANSTNVYLCQCWNFLLCFVIFVTVITQSELHFCYKNIIIVVFVVFFSYKLRVPDLPAQILFLPRQAWRALITNPGGTSLYKPYGYVPPRRVRVLHRFGLGIHFAHFGLESGWVFEGTTGVYEHFYRFNSKWVRKEEKYANSK